MVNQGYIMDAGSDVCCGQVANVIDSRQSSLGYRIRRRECGKCGERWTTYEITDTEFHSYKRDRSRLTAIISAVTGSEECES